MFNYSQAEELKTTYYRDLGFKKIAFFSAVGGSSHYNWVLSICEELGQRGHNTTFLTSDIVVKFIKPFEHVNIVPLVPGANYIAKDLANSELIRKYNQGKFISHAIGLGSGEFKRDFFAIRQYFTENNINLAICDHLAEACSNAAVSAGIPYIITSSHALSKGAEAPYVTKSLAFGKQPTSEYHSLLNRFYDQFIEPVIFIRYLFPTLKRINEQKKEVGIDAKIQDPSEGWTDAMILVNNGFGFLPPRPLGPLVQLIGPIVNKKFAPLTEPFTTFLDQHKRVVYVAFGQTATPSRNDATTILLSLLESLEHNYIDGFIWATVNDSNLFPSIVKTSFGAVYRAEDLFSATHPHVRMVTWAPQIGLLLHPSISLFVSHGGMGSFHESVFAGKPMLVFPFYADQLTNAIWINQNKLGMNFEYNTPPLDIAKKIQHIVEDKDNEFKDNLRRMQAHVQIRSKHGVARGADLIEEVLYTHKDGILEHRVTANHRMSYIKAHNLDLHALLALMLVSIVSGLGFITFKLYLFSKPYFEQAKPKTT
ncbi:hypothetical protein BD560DRAFT_437506 [Blakeslea trispora]|nr:hypothetical protein BD560DRAFT_437506 [Blakeslea trispora]